MMTHLDSVSGIGVGISQVASPWLCLYCLKNCRLQTFSIWLPLQTVQYWDWRVVTVVT